MQKIIQIWIHVPTIIITINRQKEETFLFVAAQQDSDLSQVYV